MKPPIVPPIAMFDNELARFTPQGLIFRKTPLKVAWAWESLGSSDGHQFEVRFACLMRALDNPAERRMLEETFLSRSSSVIDTQLRDHFSSALKNAAGDFLAREKGEAVNESEPVKKSLLEALEKAANRVAFTCGIEILAPFELELTSATLRRARLEQMQRDLASQRLDGQLKHFQKASDLLAQLQELRKNSPDLSPSQLLQQFPPADQAGMLQTLLMAGAKEKTSSALYAVAGPNLAKIDLRDLAGDVSRPISLQAYSMIAVPLSLGPLRSVQSAVIDGRTRLLVGARQGVYVLDPANPLDCIACIDPNMSSQLGFNGAIWANGRIYATHRDAGLVAWTLDKPQSPTVTIRPAQMGAAAVGAVPPTPTDSSISMLGSGSGGSGPGNLRRLDDRRLIFSQANQAWVLDHKDNLASLPASGTSSIAALLVADDRIITVHNDGLVVIRSSTDYGVIAQSRPAGRIETAVLMPWLGDWRLLLAPEDGTLLCMGLNDALLTQFQGPYRGLRSLSAGADLIAAVSSDRNRLVFWKTWDPNKPAADLHATSTLQHRVADIDLE